MKYKVAFIFNLIALASLLFIQLGLYTTPNLGLAAIGVGLLVLPLVLLPLAIGTTIALVGFVTELFQRKNIVDEQKRITNRIFIYTTFFIAIFIVFFFYVVVPFLYAEFG